jgi:hypothetical protein
MVKYLNPMDRSHHEEPSQLISNILKIYASFVLRSIDIESYNDVP